MALRADAAAALAAEDRRTAARAIIDAQEFAVMSSRTKPPSGRSWGIVHWKTAESLATLMPETYRITRRGRRIRNIKLHPEEGEMTADTPQATAEESTASRAAGRLVRLGIRAWTGKDRDRPYVGVGADAAALLAARLEKAGKAASGGVRLIITSAEGVVGRIEDYRGPVPRAGEYIFHPPFEDDGTSDLSVHGVGVMSVKSVTYGMLARPQSGEEHFAERPVNVVEVWV